MSNKSRSTAAAIRSNGNAPPNGQAFASDFKDIVTLISNLSGDSEGFKDYSRLYDSESRLKSELEKKVEELNTLKNMDKDYKRKIEEVTKEKRILKEEFTSSFMEWQEESKSYVKVLEELSKVKPELEEHRKKLKEANAKESQLSRDLKLSEERNKKLENQKRLLELDVEKSRLELSNYSRDQEQVTKDIGVIPITIIEKYELSKL
jgi:chromosome segregation ATPase